MESKMPLVSVIIPTFNNAHLIEIAIQSVMNQSYQNWEIIVVDNNSIDNTKLVLEKYSTSSNFNFFQLSNNGIIAKSRNFGISKAAGEYIAFLDSDDWWKPSKLMESVIVLENGADLVYHDLWEAKKHDFSLLAHKVKTRKLKNPAFDDLLLNGNGIINSSVVVRKTILDKVGKIAEDPDFIAWEDFEYWLRISQVTEKLTRIPNCLGYYWIGGGNVSNPKKTLTILNKILERYANFYKTVATKGQFPSWIHYGILSCLLEIKSFKMTDLHSYWKNLNSIHRFNILVKFVFSLL